MSWGDDYGVQTDYNKSKPAYTWYERQAKRMGRKLNLSHLSDTECRQILDVIQRDYQIRQKEKQRLGKLSKEVHEEEQKRVVLSRQQKFNEKYCICCFSSFGLIFRKRIKCSNCEFFACKDCMAKSTEDGKEKLDSSMCLGCLQQRELQVQACEWFYGQIKSRFRRFGSAKVVRSLYKRNSEESDSGEQDSDSGVDHQLSPPPASYATSEDPAVVFMGQQGFVLVSHKQTNTDDDNHTAILETCIEEEHSSWRHPNGVNTTTTSTQAPQDMSNLDSDSRLHPEGTSFVEPPIAACYAENLESARIVSMDDGARAVIEMLGQMAADDQMEGIDLGDDEGSDKFHIRRKRSQPEVVVLSPNDESSRKVKFDEMLHIVQPEDGDKLQSSSIPYHILSPIEEVSSPESAMKGNKLTVKGDNSNTRRMSGDGADKKDCSDDSLIHNDERNCRKFFPEDDSYNQEGAERLSLRDFNSGIHMPYCLSLDDGKDGEHIPSGSQECLLSPGSRKQHSNFVHSRNSDSLDSFSSMSIHSLDANDTVDSLETHYNSGHSEINSPDINEDFESGASTLVGKSEELHEDDQECKSLEIETMSLSRSSSEETLKTENEEDEREQELILADFLDQLQDRSSSMSSDLNDDRNNENDGFDRKNTRNLDLSRFVPNGCKSQRSGSFQSRPLHRCNSQPEFVNREEFTPVKERQRETKSSHSKSHKSKNAYKRSNSSDEFRYSHHKRSEEREFHLPVANMAEVAKGADIIGDIRQMEDKTSPTNRFICYDSLPLVVEVCEAEYTSPTHHVSDYRRLSIEYGGYDRQASERSARKHRNRRMDWQRRFSPKSSFEENDARQASLESNTTEDTLPKSTSLSSGPTTPESDKWRKDSQALISSEAESFSDSAKDQSKSPEKDTEFSRISSSIISDLEAKINNIPDNKIVENELMDTSKETKNKTDEFTRPSGKTKLTRSNRVLEESVEKSVLSTENVSKDENIVKDTECKPSLPPFSPLLKPTSNTPSTSPEKLPQPDHCVSSSPRTSPGLSPKLHCRRKENLEIANLTKKVSMKQEEVLQSAEEVLSSANQLSDIQASVEDLECRMDTLEKSVVGSFSAESGSDEEGPSSQDPLSPQEQVVEDVQTLEKQLAKAQEGNMQTEAKSATAVRLITATALKVLSTTENIIESEHASLSASTLRLITESDKDDHLSDDEDASLPPTKLKGGITDKDRPKDKSDEIQNHDIVATECVFKDRGLAQTRPSTEGMHLDLNGKEKREPTSEGCAESGTSPSFQGAHFQSTKTRRSSPRKRSHSPYGNTGCSILRVHTHEGASPTATLIHDIEDDVRNGNDMGAAYETPTASSRPPIPSVRGLPTGSSQEDEAIEEKKNSPRASPVGQEDAVQAALYEDIAELEEKVYLSAGKVFTLEERLQQLEGQVDKIDHCSPEEAISDLEDSIALTMAQVAQSESQIFSVEEQIAILSQSRPMFSSSQVVHCPAKGSPSHHPGVSMATLDTTGEKLDEASEDINSKGAAKKWTPVSKRVALYEMHIGGSDSSTEQEPASPTMTAPVELQKSKKVQKQAKVVL